MIPGLEPKTRLAPPQRRDFAGKGHPGGGGGYRAGNGGGDRGTGYGKAPGFGAKSFERGGGGGGFGGGKSFDRREGGGGGFAPHGERDARGRGARPVR